MRKGILALAFLLFLLVPGFSWLSGWNYRKEITITEQSGNDLTDYQVLLTIDTATLISEGKLGSDCGDLRFTDDQDNLLSYWIEDGCNTASTRVWVKIPSIPASSNKIIYMYYGNPSATTLSDFTSVFGTGIKVFVDFNKEGTNVYYDSATDWGSNNIQYSSGVSTTTGIYGNSMQSSSGVDAKITDSNYFDDLADEGTIVWCFKPDTNLPDDGRHWFWDKDVGGANSGDAEAFIQSTTDGGKMRIDLGQSSADCTFYSTTASWSSSQWYCVLLTWKNWNVAGSGEAKLYINGQLETSVSGKGGCSPFTTDSDISIAWYIAYGGGEYYGKIDNLRIYNIYIDNPSLSIYPIPSYSVGYEETTSNLDFSWSPLYPYTNETVNFTAIATDNYIQFCWDFNDSSPIECTTENTTTHVFGQAGDYQVKLIAYNNDTATNDTVVKTIHITNPLVINSITWTPDPLYKNEEATFSADVSGGSGSYTYSWDFGDGQTGSGNPTTHTYTSAGTFQVNLTVQDSYGHQTYKSVEVPVYYLEASISHDHEPVLNNETLTFEATYYSSNPAKNESFYWDFGDGSSLVKTTQPTITHVYYTTSDSQSFTACVNYSDGFRNATACQDITVYKPRLTDCSTLSTTKTLTFHLKKEQDPDSDVESTTERHLEVAFRISSSYGYEGGFSFNFVNKTTQDICIYPATAKFLTNATIQFWATGYSRRNYYLYNAELTNTTRDIYLYLLPDPYSSQITIQVLDASSNGIYGVYVKALRYYVGEDAYKTVAMGQTDLDGRTVIPLQAYDTYYKFILEKDGQIIKEIPPMQIYSSTLTFQTALEPGLFWQWYGKIAYDCTFNNETLVYRCTVSDPTNLMQSSSLVVWKKGLTSDILICNTTVYSTSATLTCTFPDLNSTYMTYLYVDLGQGKALLHSQVFEFGGIRFNVSLGLIITLMLTLTLSLMGINHPDEVIILSVVGLLLGKIMGFAPISTASLVSLIVVAGITIYREGI